MSLALLSRTTLTADGPHLLRGFRLVLYIAAATLVAWIPSQAIVWVVQQISGGPSVPELYSSPFKAVLGTLLLAPLLETLLMRYAFQWLGKWISKPLQLNLASSLLWGLAHLNAGWGLHAVWAFFVMGACFLQFRHRSIEAAILVTAVVHILYNALSYGVYLLGG